MPDRANSLLRSVGRQPWHWWAITLAYAGVLAVVSLIPIPSKAPAALLSLDKAIHLCEYGVFAWLLTVSAHRSAWPFLACLFLAFVGATGYGALLEALQAWVPYRSAEGLDLIANTVGSGLGAWLGMVVSGRERNR